MKTKARGAINPGPSESAPYARAFGQAQWPRPSSLNSQNPRGMVKEPSETRKRGVAEMRAMSRRRGEMVYPPATLSGIADGLSIGASLSRRLSGAR